MSPRRTLVRTLRLDCKIGIYRGEYVARIYSDRVIITAPFIRWESDSAGEYSERKERITDPEIYARIRAAREQKAAWAIIGDALGGAYLQAQAF